MWLLISIFKLTMVSVLSLPYEYNNYNTNAQVYHPMYFETREISPYGNNDAKISHTLSTVNKEYGSMQRLTPSSILNTPNYYTFAPATTPIPIAPQPQLHFKPVIVRQHYTMPVTPRINYQPSTVTSSSNINAMVPTKKKHNDLEYQNTHNLEKSYDDSDDDDGDSAKNSQKLNNRNQSQNQELSHGNDPRDPKIQKSETKLPERKDRIDFQVYGFDGPKSYKFGYDTGKGQNRQFRYETRDRDGNVSGRYGYVDRAGKLNVVKYTSNADDGFRTETL